ncbi:collagen alpha-1(I) chain-like [Manis pentadactyla]|uniref:collagen alpha-1(I) chain-like n=1 Tax=Manis pentadactyla TaxID=143292 RepID=UPI00255CD009|nr:collagen alpha-1(I) chain-like [Manis pentadactyla]
MGLRSSDSPTEVQEGLRHLSRCSKWQRILFSPGDLHPPGRQSSFFTGSFLVCGVTEQTAQPRAQRWTGRRRSAHSASDAGPQTLAGCVLPRWTRSHPLPGGTLISAGPHPGPGGGEPGAEDGPLPGAQPSRCAPGPEVFGPGPAAPPNPAAPSPPPTPPRPWRRSGVRERSAAGEGIRAGAAPGSAPAACLSADPCPPAAGAVPRPSPPQSSAFLSIEPFASRPWPTSRRLGLPGRRTAPAHPRPPPTATQLVANGGLALLLFKHVSVGDTAVSPRGSSRGASPWLSAWGWGSRGVRAPPHRGRGLLGRRWGARGWVGRPTGRLSPAWLTRCLRKGRDTRTPGEQSKENPFPWRPRGRSLTSTCHQLPPLGPEPRGRSLGTSRAPWGARRRPPPPCRPGTCEGRRGLRDALAPPRPGAAGAGGFGQPAAHPPGLALCPAPAPRTLLRGSGSRALRGASARGDRAGGARPGTRSPAGRSAGPEAQRAGSPSASGRRRPRVPVRDGTGPRRQGPGWLWGGAEARGASLGCAPAAPSQVATPTGRRLEEGPGQHRPEHARVGRAFLREAQPQPAPACSGPSRGGGGGRGGGRRSARGRAVPRRGRKGPPRRRIASRGQFEDPNAPAEPSRPPGLTGVNGRRRPAALNFALGRNIQLSLTRPAHRRSLKLLPKEGAGAEQQRVDLLHDKMYLEYQKQTPRGETPMISLSTKQNTPQFCSCYKAVLISHEYFHRNKKQQQST